MVAAAVARAFVNVDGGPRIPRDAFVTLLDQVARVAAPARATLLTELVGLAISLGKAVVAFGQLISATRS